MFNNKLRLIHSCDDSYMTTLMSIQFFIFIQVVKFLLILESDLVDLILIYILLFYVK